MLRKTQVFSYKGLLLLRHYQLRVEHRPSTISFHVLLSLAIFSNSFHVLPITCTSFSTSLRQVFFGLPLRLAPWGFHERACLVTFVVGFLNVWPIHLHLLFLYFLFYWNMCCPFPYSCICNFVIPFDIHYST